MPPSAPPVDAGLGLRACDRRANCHALPSPPDRALCAGRAVEPRPRRADASNVPSATVRAGTYARQARSQLSWRCDRPTDRLGPTNLGETDACAVLAWQGGHPLRYGARIPRSRRRAMRSSRSRAAPSAAPICTSTTASCPAWKAATSWATSSWARSSRSAGRTGSSRSATGSWCHSPSLAASASSAGAAISRSASARTATRRRPTSCSVIAPPACSATRI